MKIISEVKPEEVVASFLKSEIDSSRFSEIQNKFANQLHLKRDDIVSPNLEDISQNLVRAKVLAKTRGWGENKLIFSNFPANVEWYKISYTLAELGNMLNLKMKEASSTIKERVISSKINGFNADEQHLQQIIDKVETDGDFEPIIIVAESMKGVPIILEGNSRALAYFSSQKLPNSEAYIGISPEMNKWRGHPSQEGF